jgi:hypothetical protein
LSRDPSQFSNYIGPKPAAICQLLGDAAVTASWLMV